MIKGRYSDGKTSKTIDAFLCVDDLGRIWIKDSHKAAIAIRAVRISPRIGNTARYFEFPDGAVFETDENDAVDELARQYPNGSFDNLVHRLESSKQLVAVTLLVVVLFSWGFIQFGIPYFSKEVAMLLSDEQARSLGAGVLQKMDEHLLEESELSPERQGELQSVFQSILETLQEDNMRLVFRKSKRIGANALALPDGTILFTDDLVVLADNNDEIVSVMLHEIGHVQHRHSLRMAIRSFSLAIFIAMITGDVSASSSIVTSLPVVLIESGYSRDMESEADTYSLLYMMRHHIDPGHFAVIMRKLEASHSRTFRKCREAEKAVQECLGESMNVTQKAETDEESLGDYFSSHPDTDARIRRFEQAAANAGEGVNKQ